MAIPNAGARKLIPEHTLTAWGRVAIVTLPNGKKPADGT
jgi:hypothetical protein